jgi:hypothetical protein
MTIVTRNWCPQHLGNPKDLIAIVYSALSSVLNNALTFLGYFILSFLYFINPIEVGFVLSCRGGGSLLPQLVRYCSFVPEVSPPIFPRPFPI